MERQDEDDHKGLRVIEIVKKGIFWHFLILRGLSPLLKRLFLKCYPGFKFSPKDGLLFHNHTTSFLHSLTLVYYALKLRTAFKSKVWTAEERYLGFHEAGRTSCELFVAYLIQDFLYLLYYDPIVKSRETLIHHFGYILIALYNLPNHYFVYPYMWLTLGEASTPFVSIRWILLLLGKESSVGYVINGWCLLITFFITRVVLFSNGLVDLWKTRSVWMKQSKYLQYIFWGLCSMFGLNVYWFTRIAKGAYLVLTRSMINKS